MIATAATSRRQTRIFDRGSLRKWKVTMKTLSTRTGNIRSTIGKIAMAVACALMIGGTFIAPAFADDNGRHEGYQRGRYKKSRRMYHPPPPRRYYYEPPPPVVYYPEPYQSPGISIVFPFR
jgi:hypothetical protein